MNLAQFLKLLLVALALEHKIVKLIQLLKIYLKN